MNIPIHFAPLQGYTDDVYRRIHHELMGGIHTYYTPFLRMEGGGVRSRTCVISDRNSMREYLSFHKSL